jgi:hypothetical protein
MASNISFNPYLTTNGAGSFSVQSDGYVQGSALDDPTIRNRLAGGWLNSTETLPMWGGIAIYENVPPAGYDGTYGGPVGRATSLANLTGFSVLNQAHNWVTSPQSQAPSAGSGMTVPFYRMGSGARIVVGCDASLIAAVQGGLITQNVSWDFNNQVLQAYNSTATVALTSMTATYANGVYTIACVASAATLVGAVGDYITISGATNAGTGGNALVNGNFQVTAFTNSQNFSFQVVAASGAIGVIAGSPVLNEGTGALPVKILGVNTNSKVIKYDPINNYVNWTVGNAALIQI